MAILEGDNVKSGLVRQVASLKGTTYYLRVSEVWPDDQDYCILCIDP
jgi:hypothetical protein